MRFTYELFKARFTESLEALVRLQADLGTLTAIAEQLGKCFQPGGTLYLCGNGGSAADAQHIAAEFVGRFLKERQALPAIALTCNTSILTAVGNDYDFSQIFARQVRASVKPTDCVVGISTSGRSANPSRPCRPPSTSTRPQSASREKPPLPLPPTATSVSTPPQTKCHGFRNATSLPGTSSVRGLRTARWRHERRLNIFAASVSRRYYL